MESRYSPNQVTASEYRTQYQVNSTLGDHLPKRTSGRCLEILKGLFPQRAAHSILERVRIGTYDVYKTAEIAELLPHILAAFVSKEHDIVAIDGTDMHLMIEHIIERVVSTKDLSDFVIAIGMGGSEEMPNLRLAGTIAPALHTLKHLHVLEQKKKLQRLPTVVVFKANHLSTLVNGLDIERVERVTNLSFLFLEEFITTFTPELRDSVVMTSDADPRNPEHCQLYEDLQRGAHLLKHSTGPEIQSILDMGAKHGGAVGIDHAFLYAAAHVYYPQIITEIDRPPILKKFPKTPAVVVNHGGRPAQTFAAAARRLIANSAGDARYRIAPLVDMIIKPGKIPPYYTARLGDIPIGQTFDDPIGGGLRLDIDPSTVADYEAIFGLLQKLGYTYQDFNGFVRAFHAEHRAEIKALQPLQNLGI